MFRKSIYDTTQRFEGALREVADLINRGEDEEKIPGLLSVKYQEKEIKDLLTTISRISTLKEHKGLKRTLRTSLAILLLFRVLSAHLLLISIDLAPFWDLLIFISAIILLTVALILSYREIPASYTIIFLILLFYLSTSSSFVDNVEILFTTHPLNLLWIITFLVTTAFLVAFVVSWKLYRIYPPNLLSTQKAIQKLHLTFDKVKTGEPSYEK